MLSLDHWTWQAEDGQEDCVKVNLFQKAAGPGNLGMLDDGSYKELPQTSRGKTRPRMLSNSEPRKEPGSFWSGARRRGPCVTCRVLQIYAQAVSGDAEHDDDAKESEED